MNKSNKKFLPLVLFFCFVLNVYAEHVVDHSNPSLDVDVESHREEIVVQGVPETFDSEKGISIEKVSGEFENLFYQIDASINYNLSESAIEALRHGITLRFDITIDVERVRKWVWDKNVATSILSFQLSYLSLNNNYLVVNMVTGERKQLQELGEALEFLGKIENFPIVRKNDLDPTQSYNFSMISEFRIRSLPLPLQPLAFISPQWDLSSQRYESAIK